MEAIKKTNYAGGLMQYAGPVVFNEIGDNPNAVTTMIQILGQKPVAVWPQGGRAPEVRVPAAQGAERPLDPTLVAQGLLSGLLFGGVYSLMAVGLTLIFGVMRVVNFAHGDMMVWGMYLAWILSTRAGHRSLPGLRGLRGRALRAGRGRPARRSSTASWTRPTRCRSS